MKSPLGPILSAKDGRTLQKITGDRDKDLNRSYVKIRNPAGRVLDTALTVPAARRRVKYLKEQLYDFLP